MAETDLREQAILDQVHIEALRRRLEFRKPWVGSEDWWEGDRRDAEIERLQAVVAQQSSEIAVLRSKLEDAEETARLVALQDLVDAVLAAVQRGAWALEDLQVTEATVELKVILDVRDSRPGLIVGPAGAVDPHAFSTLRFELRRLS